MQKSKRSRSTTQWLIGLASALLGGVSILLGHVGWTLALVLIVIGLFLSLLTIVAVVLIKRSVVIPMVVAPFGAVIFLPLVRADALGGVAWIGYLLMTACLCSAVFGLAVLVEHIYLAHRQRAQHRDSLGPTSSTGT